MLPIIAAEGLAAGAAEGLAAGAAEGLAAAEGKAVIGESMENGLITTGGGGNNKNNTSGRSLTTNNSWLQPHTNNASNTDNNDDLLESVRKLTKKINVVEQMVNALMMTVNKLNVSSNEQLDLLQKIHESVIFKASEDEIATPTSKPVTRGSKEKVKTPVLKLIEELSHIFRDSALLLIGPFVGPVMKGIQAVRNFIAEHSKIISNAISTVLQTIIAGETGIISIITEGIASILDHIPFVSKNVTKNLRSFGTGVKDVGSKMYTATPTAVSGAVNAAGHKDSPQQASRYSNSSSSKSQPSTTKTTSSSSPTSLAKPSSTVKTTPARAPVPPAKPSSTVKATLAPFVSSSLQTPVNKTTLPPTSNIATNKASSASLSSLLAQSNTFPVSNNFVMPQPIMVPPVPLIAPPLASRIDNTQSTTINNNTPQPLTPKMKAPPAHGMQYGIPNPSAPYYAEDMKAVFFKLSESLAYG